MKTTLVTFMGLPHITISVVPMSERLPNVMNVPFISGFISSAINTAAAEYVAPKSLTIDLQKFISGDDIKKGDRCSFEDDVCQILSGVTQIRMPLVCLSYTFTAQLA